MPDLTNIQNDLIIICPDAKAMTAFETWKDKLNAEEKANFTIDSEKYIISSPDPLGTLDAKRKEFIALINDNAEEPTSIVRLRFDGPTFAAISMVVGPLPEEPE